MVHDTATSRAAQLWCAVYVRRMCGVCVVHGRCMCGVCAPYCGECAPCVRPTGRTGDEKKQSRPHQTKPHQTKPHQTPPDPTRPNPTRLDQTRPDQTRPYRTKPRPTQTRPNGTDLQMHLAAGVHAEQAWLFPRGRRLIWIPSHHPPSLLPRH